MKRARFLSLTHSPNIISILISLIPLLITNFKKNKLRNSQKESLSKQNIKPSDLVEKIKTKFQIDMKYQDSANLLYKVKEDIFGNPGLDASNLKILCEEISQKFSTFYFKFKGDIDNKFCSLFFATAGMKEEYKHNYNLLILDTTFGTNRSQMPLIVGSLMNNMGRTVICFFALISEETTLQFQWVFDCFMECF